MRGIHSMCRSVNTAEAPVAVRPSGGQAVSLPARTSQMRIRKPKLPAGIPSNRLQAVDEGSEINYSVHRAEALFPQVRAHVGAKEI
jgi:hypothetical protein